MEDSHSGEEVDLIIRKRGLGRGKRGRNMLMGMESDSAEEEVDLSYKPENTGGHMISQTQGNCRGEDSG